MGELKYRPDIDGLRAIAVLAVVLFHAGVQTLSGGFSGVDVFFVISGYLITSIIVREIREGNLSLLTFYERRMRRILPALFVVLAFTSVGSFLLYNPAELEGYGESLIAAAISASNFLFWSESGYFDSLAEVKPLLHTWSLGVEEQFYILFPIILLAISRVSRQRYTAWILTILLVSLMASIRGVAHWPSAAFYLLHARAWELAVGALLALGSIPVIHHRHLREMVALGGIFSIGWGFVALTSDAPFPGANALFPCLGAALVIHAGSSGSTRIGRMLSWKPLVLIGLVSYSLYLWHWPLLVFARFYKVIPLTGLETTGVLLVAFAAAFASWHFIERPFRKRRSVFTRRTVFVSGMTLTLLMVAFGSSVVVTKGWPGRVDRDVLRLAYGALDFSKSSRMCMERNRSGLDYQGLCIIGKRNGVPSFIVLGDSHAGALMPGVAMAAKNAGATGFDAAADSCPPLDGVLNQLGDEGEQCLEFRNRTLDLIERIPSIQKVILISRWPTQAEGTRYGRDDPGPKPMLVDIENKVQGSHEVFSLGVERIVKRLRRANKQVYMVFSVPEVGWNVPSVSARNLFIGRNFDIRPRLSDFHARNAYVSAVFNRMAGQYGVKVLYPDSILCGKDLCEVTKNGRALYYDDDHLSVFGAESISSIFEPVFVNSPGESSR